MLSNVLPKLRRFLATARSVPHARIALAVLAGLAPLGSANAQTGSTGGGQPFNNYQPTLTVTQAMETQGIYPTQSGSGAAYGQMDGFIYSFAGNVAPLGTIEMQGQSLRIFDNTTLFAVLSVAYGGDGVTTFNLPDLSDRATMGSGTGPGLSTRSIGQPVGTAGVSLAALQIPAHVHSLPGGAFTGSAGAGLPFDNVEPSLPLTRLIAYNVGATGGAVFPGQVATFAGDFVPDGWLPADGRLLPINAQYSALFSAIGTNFGGNGLSTFALPDLRGRISVGADATHPLGTPFGEEATSVTISSLAAHDHTTPGGGRTGSTGASAPLENQQPSLALNYLVSLAGIFPATNSGGLDPNVPIMGQIVEYAGNTPPSPDWAFADGSLMSISAFPALYFAMGTTYGGDGNVTFALPDLRGRTLAGASAANPVGTLTGSTSTTLSVANLPPHVHMLPVPSITSATYDASTGVLTVTGDGMLENAGGADITASKLTLTGQGGSAYTLTDTADVDIASSTGFSLTLSTTDRAQVDAILDKNGTASTDGTAYNLAAAEDWDTGADPAAVIADLTGNAITVSSVAPPIPTFTVTPSAGANGTIAPATPQSIASGASATFTVTPGAGYSASVGGSCGGTLAGTTYTTDAIVANCSVVATFTAIPSRSYTGPSATGSGSITASFTGGGAGCGFASAAFIPLVGGPRSPPAGSAPVGISFPHGLFDFTLTGCTAGSTVSFTIVYPRALPADTAYWKYGPTPGDATAHWYALPASVGGDTVRFAITDGSTGDDDLAANGAIVDQGGPGAPGGPVQVPTLSDWARMLLAGLLGVAGAWAVQRRPG